MDEDTVLKTAGCKALGVRFPLLPQKNKMMKSRVVLEGSMESSKEKFRFNPKSKTKFRLVKKILKRLQK